MPIYEYECDNCGKTFEIFQKIGDNPLNKCRVCGGALNKLISQCSFHLKGTGWYVTDYKKPVDTVGNIKHKEKEETTTETAPSATAEAVSTATKSETKTETKSAEHTGG
ncbi:MAG: FmdB family transcriptional regulator [Syntrophus sp. (in: bacteria)]|nr:FmdB family transcriptional regulator [Syntrophus sp. (in: bacteria)]